MSNNSNNYPVAVVCGVGEGIGAAVAEKFASQGYTVALIARTYDTLQTIASAINKNVSEQLAYSYACDLAREQSVKQAFNNIKAELGNVNVLIYNAGARRVNGRSVIDVTTEELHNFFAINYWGAVYATRCVLPDMIHSKQGTIIYTGATASLRARDGLLSFSPGKFALRALAQTVAREYQKEGIHVIHTIIDGPVDGKLIGGVTRRKFERAGRKDELQDIEAILMQPKDIAEQYYWLHKQPKSTWSFEIDLRSYKEVMFSKL